LSLLRVLQLESCERSLSSLSPLCLWHYRADRQLPSEGFDVYNGTKHLEKDETRETSSQARHQSQARRRVHESSCSFYAQLLFDRAALRSATICRFVAKAGASASYSAFTPGTPTQTEIRVARYEQEKETKPHRLALLGLSRGRRVL
jgi:hypothetical protein